MSYQPKRDRQPPAPAHRKRGNTVRTSNAYLDTSPFERGVDQVVARNFYRDDRRYGKDVADHLPSRSVKDHLQRFDSHRPTKHAVQQQRRQYPSEQDFVRRHKRQSRYDSSSDSSSDSDQYSASSSDDSASDDDHRYNRYRYKSNNRRPTYNFHDDESDSQSDSSDHNRISGRDSDSASYSSSSDAMEGASDMQVQPNKRLNQQATKQKQPSGGKPAKRQRTEPARDDAAATQHGKAQTAQQSTASPMSEQLQGKIRDAVALACDISKELDRDALIKLVEAARSEAAPAPASAASDKEPRASKTGSAQPTRTSPRKAQQQSKAATSKKQTKAKAAKALKTPKAEAQQPKVEAEELETANAEVAAAVNTPSQSADAATPQPAPADTASAPSEHRMSLRNSPTEANGDGTQPAQA